MKQIFSISALALSLLSQGANAFGKSPSINKVVYGVDNRLELRHTPYSYLRNSVAGLASRSVLKESEDKELLEVLYYGDLTSYRGRTTCDDFKFREQATLPTCTGFLVEEDILVTAGHCVLNYGNKVQDKMNYQCFNARWVFGYEDNSESKDGINFPKDDVYGCSQIIDASYTTEADYAVIKLDRKTVGKQALTLSSEVSDYKAGTQIFVVGHPTGLPLKLAAGAKVVHNMHPNNFITNLDTFGGNSGSPIFNFYGEAIGILVSGETDYYFDKERECITPNKCDAVDGTCNVTMRGKASGETGTKIHLVTKALKAYKERTAAKAQ
ncbi:serine protease [Bacteriovorax sp. Seq25_V]|uniref:trypsin-like serine peptidase n=1 Tax=Bacteriovorax sp. Seq25_V TaxID=1201288 RepID=UPI000389EC4A|nr:serine protease [Bacteriovorax sp. Seq25_V]EQC47729.1 trypsin [Bacteriovorax sp. Seq25_V]